jgi:WD40 repeat protein/serine/threonine protein kinase
MACPSSERLALLVAEELPPDEHRALEVHVEGCSSCQDLLDQMTGPEEGDVPPVDGTSLAAGVVVSCKYRIRRRIDRGGQGEVYEAWQQDLQRPVALKLVWGGGLGRLRLDEFRKEAALLAGLRHPHIVPIYDYGEHAGRPYFVMEYLAGGSLAARLNPGPGGATTTDVPPAFSPASAKGGAQAPGPPAVAWLPGPKEAAVLVETLARAMHYAHQQKVVHRDLKPGNILLAEDGTPKIGDFGLAWEQDSEREGASSAATAAGSLPYMAPEQALGLREHIRGWTDVYGLGAILYELLTGRPPFQAETAMLLWDQVCGQAPVPPGQVRPVPRDLGAVCLKCLAKEPARRYASAADLAEDLRHFQVGEPVRARPVGPVERYWRWCRRNPLLAAASSLAVFLLLAATALSAGWAYHASRQAEANREAQLRTQEQLAEGQFDRALAECERGEVGIGLLWLARSLETAPDRAEGLSEALRTSMATWHCRQFPLMGSYREAWNIRAFDPDGQTGWFVDRDNAVVRRDLATGQEVGPRLPHGARIKTVATSREGDVVLTVAGREARMWDVGKGVSGPAFLLPDTTETVALSPDGQTVLTACVTGEKEGVLTTVQRWDARSWRALAPSFQSRHRLAALALSPDGRTLLAAQAEYGEIVGWEVATGKPFGPLPLPRKSYDVLAFTPEGQGLVTGSRDQKARLWEMANGRPFGPTLFHRGPVQVVGFTRDGRTLLTADSRKTVRTWAVSTGPAPVKVLPHNKIVGTVAVSPDGRMAATGSYDGKACLWDTRSGARLQELAHWFSVTAVLFSPDSRTLLTIAWPNTAQLWDTATGLPRGAPLRHGKWATARAFSAGGGLVATGSFDGTARIWDAATGEPRVPLQLPAGVLAVAFDPQGARLATGCADGMAQVWDAASGRALGLPLRHGKAVWVVAFAREGDRLLTAGGDGTALLWDLATGQSVGQPMQHGGKIGVAAFSPDGRRILTGSEDGTARLWDAATGQPRGLALTHEGPVTNAVFSPDGRRVSTGSGDGTARVWDAATGRPLGPPLPHGGQVFAVAWAAGGERILTGSGDSKGRLWQVPAPVAGPVEREVLWAQVVTGLELDRAGGIHVLDTPTWQQRCQRLNELGGPPTR